MIIRSIIEELLRESGYKQIKHRIVMDDRSFKEVLSGCQLSKVISALFDEIEERKAPKKQRKGRKRHF